jgi:hypothetical protein
MSVRFSLFDPYPSLFFTFRFVKVFYPDLWHPALDQGFDIVIFIMSCRNNGGMQDPAYRLTKRIVTRREYWPAILLHTGCRAAPGIA